MFHPRAACQSGNVYSSWSRLVLVLSSMSWLGRSRPLKLRQFHSSAGCAELQNRGTHFTVELEAGTPAQTFSVVADTGSDSIIVPSCVCQKMGYCAKTDRCFTGTNRSSSFAITKPPMMVQITFGSGPIRAVVSSDFVNVGHVRHFMKEGILLMTEKELNFGGPFEGILGLGMPENATKRKESRLSDRSGESSKSVIDDIVKKIIRKYAGAHQTAAGGAGAPVSSPMIVEGMQMEGPLNESSPEIREAVGKIVKQYMSEAHDAGQSDQHYTPVQGHAPAAGSSRTSEFRAKSFLESAGISRFSLCFNDGANGVLRLDSPQQPEVLGSVGSAHWGLDLQGITVGEFNSTIAICSPSSMKPGQKSACGAIPDSGTTAIMAPAAEIEALNNHICDNWSRCRQNYTAVQKAASAASKAASDIYGVDPFDIKTPRKETILKLLLLDCNSWLTKENGLHELPDIHFHLRGAGGKTKKVALSAWSYVMETLEHEVETVYKSVGGYKIPYKRQTGVKKQVCTLNIGAMEYSTKDNGPIFILGTPLFYEFEVGYDLSAKPPGISFRSLAGVPCGSCRNDTALFSDSVASTSKLVRSPRQVHTPLRVPQIDVTQPL